MITLEAISLWGAVVGYALACAIAVGGTVLRRPLERTLITLIVLAVVLHSISIGARWMRLGHVPVGSTFEMLSANVWGLALALAVTFPWLAKIRGSAVVALPVIVLLMGWMLLQPNSDTLLPPTYKTVWLFIHIGFIKLFLGAAFVALAQAVIILLRNAAPAADRFQRLPNNASLAELSFRFLAVGWIFDSLGIMAGAIWAQNAWGRYWSWDPLETWSLATWLAIGAAVHFRLYKRPHPAALAMAVVAVFVVAFLTFFGVPFVSTALHQGAI